MAIKYNVNNASDRYGVSKRERDIFEMAKRSEKPDESFSEEPDYYESFMEDFKRADENSRSRDTVVLWYNE